MFISNATKPSLHFEDTKNYIYLVVAMYVLMYCTKGGA